MNEANRKGLKVTILALLAFFVGVPVVGGLILWLWSGVVGG